MGDPRASVARGGVKIARAPGDVRRRRRPRSRRGSSPAGVRAGFSWRSRARASMVAMRKYVEELVPDFFREWAPGKDGKTVCFTYSETSAWLAYILAKREGSPPSPPFRTWRIQASRASGKRGSGRSDVIRCERAVWGLGSL